MQEQPDEHSDEHDLPLHRRIGTKQKLFMFHKSSPGSCFFLPHGTRIYNKLISIIKDEYRKRDFHEIITPNIFNSDLWRQSGHWDHYHEHMFNFKVEEQEWSLKPMSCPAHCLMFKSERRSYRDLPIKWADFGVLHRNELSGALRGLTRVRRFQQDDAHIFCRMDQIESQIEDCLDFLMKIYNKMDLQFELELSTRPEKYSGELATWDQAEDCLRVGLDRFCKQHGKQFEINEGDGAFYGPKIDVQITDSCGRSLQCGTIQLDFQLPSKERFDLQYHQEDGNWSHPVIIHRAVLGSVERMIAVLAEHYNGQWPFWLSPRQIAIVPIVNKEEILEYGRKLQNDISDWGYYVDLDDSTDRLNKKILNAQHEQYNLILVIGAKEVEKGTVNIRNGRSSDKIDIEIKDLQTYLLKTV